MDPQLTKAKESFAHWKSLGNRCGRATNELKKMALDLLAQYPHKFVCEALSISPKTLKNWQEKRNQSHLETAFVDLPIPGGKSLSTEIKISLPHGIQLHLPTQSVEQSSQLIVALVKEFSLCSI